jgi:hypothetical protein
VMTRVPTNTPMTKARIQASKTVYGLIAATYEGWYPFPCPRRTALCSAAYPRLLDRFKGHSGRETRTMPGMLLRAQPHRSSRRVDGPTGVLRRALAVIARRLDAWAVPPDVRR